MIRPDPTLDMWDLADELGLHITEAHDRHPSGYWPDDQSIGLTRGMGSRATRSVLAHEIGHHVLGHLPTDDDVLRARQERAANEWAAARLIPASAYAEAERIREGRVSLIAFDLHVTDELVIAYQGMLDRCAGRLTA